MGDWWYANIIEPGKLPLFLCAVSFVVTFGVTRLVVRMIKAGRGPFTDNSFGGVHMHHMVPGVVIMTITGLTAVGTTAAGWLAVAGLGFGIGLALVLDEFALLFHLDDVYWSEEGRTSIDAVFLCGGVFALLLLGWAPFGVNDLNSTDISLRILVMVNYVLLLLAVAVAFAKGKIASGVIGFLVPFVAMVAAIRIARPKSPWAHSRYGQRRPLKALESQDARRTSTAGGAPRSGVSRTSSPDPSARTTDRRGGGGPLSGRYSRGADPSLGRLGADVAAGR